MTSFLLLATLFLVAGLVAVPLATRFGLGSVLGYLIAGIALSPALTALRVDVVEIQHFAEFGVVMMLFLVGLELEPKRLWEMRTRLLGLGGLQVVLTAAAVMATAMLLGQPWRVGLAIGLVLALSSTAIVLQTLGEKGLLKSDGGQASFSVLLTQDIAVIPMLALIPLLAVAGDGSDAAGAGEAGHGAEAAVGLVADLPGWAAALVTLGAIAAVVLCGALLTGPVFRYIAAARLRELFVAAALLIVCFIALLMTLVGLSPALGTFIAGVVLANSEYRHELESDIDPFRGMLLGLFFMTVGAGINFALLFGEFAIVVGLTLGLMALKAAMLSVLALVFRLRGPDRSLFILGLAQAGEFGFVLLSLIVANAVIPQALADRLLLIVALSMLLTPLLFIFHDRVVAPRFAQRAAREADRIDEEGEVLILGHGRFGGIVNRMLRLQGFRTVVIDYSAQQLEMLRTFGLRIYFGDATRPELLEAAGIARARLVVVAIDGADETTRIVEHIVRTYPHVHIVARARNRHHTYELWFAGCRDIIRETYDSSIRAGRSSLEALGLSHEEASARARAFEIRDRAVMVEVAELYDPNIPATENAPYVAKVREVLQVWEEDLTGDKDEVEFEERDLRVSG